MSIRRSLRRLFGRPSLAAPRDATPPRPDFFDFDPFRRNDRPEFRDAPLATLTYVVFDTETTGLYAARGDAVVSIGAVRAVGAHIRAAETFDRLVNPRRKIPPASTRIHGIDDAMVRAAPTMEAVLPAFRDFVGDAVLVAHNAAFDLNFLAQHETATGVRLSNPVLDTMFLADLLYGKAGNHSLDALAKRFGVELEARHSALGDALATAEVFVRLLDGLAARGIATFGDASDAARMMPNLRSATARFARA